MSALAREGIQKNESKTRDFQNGFIQDFALIKSLWVEIFLPVWDLPTALALDYRPTLQFFRQFQDFDMDSLTWTEWQLTTQGPTFCRNTPSLIATPPWKGPTFKGNLRQSLRAIFALENSAKSWFLQLEMKRKLSFRGGACEGNQVKKGGFSKPFQRGF